MTVRCKNSARELKKLLPAARCPSYPLPWADCGAAGSAAEKAAAYVNCPGACLPARNFCNHVSFMDPIILGGSVTRPMRFVMYFKIFQMPFLRFIFKNAKAIPIASAKEDRQLMDEAFEKVDAELAAGNIVCIFPEGGLTHDGEVQKFR